jgi:thioester reductase-like protein
MPVTIFRPGRLTGNSQTGAWRTNDLICRQIKGCIQLGSVPNAIFSDRLEMTPVDYISQAMVAISLQHNMFGKIFHLQNQIHTDVERLVTWIKEFGYQLEQQPYQIWRDTLQRAVEQGRRNVLASFLATYPEQLQEAEPQVEVMRTVYDDQQTRAALAGTSISCPPLDQQLIHRYLEYFVKIGFLPEPPG